jgi:hypothetical protein
VNTKALYAAGGGIAAAAIAIFFITGSGNIRLPGGQVGNQTSQQLQLEPELSIRNVTIIQLDNGTKNVKISFGMYNPNSSPLYLEALQYTLTVGKFRMAGGDIGGGLEGFVASSADLTPIPSKNTVPLNDITPIATRNNPNAASWDSMIEGTAQYEISGFYSYRTTSRLETTTGEKEFTLTFP